MNKVPQVHLPYLPEEFPRELNPFYLGAGPRDLELMLSDLKLEKLEDLFAHIPAAVRFFGPLPMEGHLSYQQLAQHMVDVANKNNARTSFIGDALKHYKVPEIVEKVCQVRGLTTAYTPYQPERGQGTLIGLWIYASLISRLTGFEAINASLYDRSTALYEALCCAQRLVKNAHRVLIFESIHPQDRAVVDTMAKYTSLQITLVPLDCQSGRTHRQSLAQLIQRYGDEVAAVAFPQINSLGNLEDVDEIVDTCTELNPQLRTIAVIDPITLASGGLKPPSHFGSQQQGAHILVGEGQHLAIGPNYGGPGLGIFGIRYNAQDRNSIRATPGRFVGKAKDCNGRDCFSLILSTREQHIRRDKATSNICSNQSFVATLVGAAILDRGEEGMQKACTMGVQYARKMYEFLAGLSGVEFPFVEGERETAFYNEFVIRVDRNVETLIQAARQHDIHLGVNVSDRLSHSKIESSNTCENNFLLLSFFDHHTEEDLQKLRSFFGQQFLAKAPATTHKGHQSKTPAPIPLHLQRQEAVQLPSYTTKFLEKYYQRLGELNVSPDQHVYALGSCTMKYNPYINDFAASLPGFTQLHPQAPLEDSQGSMHILYEIQKMFNQMTGLAATTTQPVAGAQGELVGLKLFQAYFADRGELEQRQILLIPHSAHGTNPATATVAGLATKTVDGVDYGIQGVQANEMGMIDFTHLESLVQKYGNRIMGIMVTNPNTSGLFETDFQRMAQLIHSVGGLVYMDGANMNAIAGQVNLAALGVDAVHNNLHKTWTIPHGGGGPGDAIVAVSSKLVDYLPGVQVVLQDDGSYSTMVPKKSIGSFHRHFGNFAHKVRCYTYLKALGGEGIQKMSAVAVLSARYLFEKLANIYPTLPAGARNVPRMHEFIISISPNTFSFIENAGIPKAQAIIKIGKLFLDFGLHAPTVAFPETFGLMIEPTESYSKVELDHFYDVVKAIHLLVNETPEVLQTVPHFTPVDRIEEVNANRTPLLSESLESLPEIYPNRISVDKLLQSSVGEVCKAILQAHQERCS